MALNRRKFTRIALIGGASFAASSGIFFPKPSEAFILGFLLRGLTARAGGQPRRDITVQVKFG
ncbi:MULTISPECIES: hypothetical protein [Cyanophyceae]|uniref:hypothetical protein n=1 Tax=Cyanophyceae TaxID=3028117 RepID=UPI0016832D36|nr:hypothetical protein [Trichocoleus sp. FACHB-69]MBD1933068.1 hypothetical protein [Trichocoleus sp. FACHB-69]